MTQTHLDWDRPLVHLSPLAGPEGSCDGVFPQVTGTF